MSINFDALKADLDRLTKQTSRSSSGDTSIFWSPKEGEQTVRIVPYVHDRTDCFRRFYYHYDVGSTSIVSPISFGRPDPILEFGKKLQSKGDKESWIFGKKLEPKMRIYAPVIVRGLEHKGPLFWGFSEKVHKDLAKFLLSGDYGDISDLQTGRDIVIDYTPGRGNVFAQINLWVKPNTSPAFTDQAMFSKLEEMPVIENILKAPSEEELVEILEMYLNPQNKKEVEEQAPVSNNSTQDTAIPNSSNNVKSALEQFDNLFSKG